LGGSGFSIRVSHRPTILRHAGNAMTKIYLAGPLFSLAEQSFNAELVF